MFSGHLMQIYFHITDKELQLLLHVHKRGPYSKAGAKGRGHHRPKSQRTRRSNQNYPNYQYRMNFVHVNSNNIIEFNQRRGKRERMQSMLITNETKAYSKSLTKRKTNIIYYINLSAPSP